MRKLLMVVAAFCVLLTSCAKDEPIATIEKEAIASFTIQATEMVTRAYGEGTKATTLYWAVYDSVEGIVAGLSSGDDKTATMDGLSTTIKISLVEGRSYTILFWAQNAEAPYKRTWGTQPADAQISYTNTAVLKANDDKYDAFFGKVILNDVKGAVNQTVELFRPFAQLNIATSDIAKASAADFDVVRTGVKVSNVYTAFGLAKGEVRGNAVEEIVFDTTDMAEGTIEVNGKQYDMLSMSYLLVSDKRLVDISLMLQENNSVTKVLTRTYTSVPVERNYRTNIVGSILTNDAEFTVEVRPGFTEGDLMKWDGEMTSKPTYDAATNTYYISHAAELAWIAALVNGTLPTDMRSTDEAATFAEAETLAGATIILEHDIDLGGKEWTPIGDYAFSRTFFSGTLDGRGHTISDFKVTEYSDRPDKADKSSYGLFGNMNGTVKNVTIENGTVTPANNGAYVGVLVGRLKEGGLIENCHVKNSVATTTYWQVGGIVGQVEKAGNIKDCSIEKSTITGRSAAGAIVGLIMDADEYTIEDCEVKECDIVQGRPYNDADLDSMFGLAVGAVNNSGITLNLDDITVENNTIKGEASDLLVGYIEGGAKVYIDGELVVNLTPIEGAEGIATDAEGNYVITAAAGFDYIRTNLDTNDGFAGKTITLNDDITLSGEFTPVAAGSRSDSSASGTGFKGLFDGAGKTIDGLTIITGGKNDAIGLFGVINGGEVKNVNFTNVAINAPNCENAGTVAGLVVNGGKISGVTVESGSVVAKRGNGGIAGRLMIDGTIENCTNKAAISGTGANVAGIVGAAYYTQTGHTMLVKNCKNYGAVSGSVGGVGGIVSMSAADIEGCSNYGVVTANGDCVGGIVAEQSNAGSVIGCHNYANVTNTSGAATGGIVGWTRYNGGTTNYAFSEIIEFKNNTNDGTISGAKFVGGIIGAIYNYGIIEGNTNNAPQITATNTDPLNGKAAGLVGYALCDAGQGVNNLTDTLVIKLKSNTSNTAAANITGAATALLVNYNTTSPYITLEGNTPASN